MAVEIREMVVRTTISSGPAGEPRETLSCSGMERVKREVVAVCMERLADYLLKQKER
ncbi:DUF5908 family protein [Desulfoluna spongiiphila]|uniref:Uncharacterized protein n=1 Tax=Desulfoluna spongiiphila TaxID=419481 RepID=A0A1G5DL64_9BACT|nr:DUF5908 family protein [Desulfoluna spongiiphila]SCY15307.1 hypothetical protein SAMN05216233_104248 [Desulfoluna spongiiphila]VVS95076.1 hypothetical protein DBB_46530 [Desulfoluna spongiiphila]